MPQKIQKILKLFANGVSLFELKMLWNKLLNLALDSFENLAMSILSHKETLLPGPLTERFSLSNRLGNVQADSSKEKNKSLGPLDPLQPGGLRSPDPQI